MRGEKDREAVYLNQSTKQAPRFARAYHKVDGGRLTVGLRRGDGEREGKIWGENGLGKKNGYRKNVDGFLKFDFFFLENNIY
jgi:hypothetical protein